MKAQYPILSLCDNLDVSPSGYHDWQKRRACPGPRALENQILAREIGALYARRRQTYGSPRVVAE